MFGFKQIVTGSALALGVAFASGAAQASTIDLTTGVADWHVNGNAAVVVPPSAQPEAWVAEFGGANWITDNSDTAPDQYGGSYYTYNLTLELDAGRYSIDGLFSSDNIVTGISLGSINFDGYPLLPGTHDMQYLEVVELSQILDIQTAGTYNLNFTVYNEAVTGVVNPSAFIFAGQISAVPSPAAFGAGLAMLGGLALRRRRMA